jgi:hypothetical protein
VQIHQHVFLQRTLAVIDANTVIVSIKTVNERLDRRLIEMPQVRCTLTGLLAKHERLWVDESESINDNFAFDRLDGVNDNRDGSWGQLFKGLLGIDIDRGKPAAKTRM